MILPLPIRSRISVYMCEIYTLKRTTRTIPNVAKICAVLNIAGYNPNIQLHQHLHYCIDSNNLKLAKLLILHDYDPIRIEMIDQQNLKDLCKYNKPFEEANIQTMIRVGCQPLVEKYLIENNIKHILKYAVQAAKHGSLSILK